MADEENERPPVMRLLTTEGVVEVEVPGEGERSDVGSYWAAVQHVLDTGKSTLIKQFKGVEIEGHQLEIDTGKITRWAKQGELDFEDIYDLS